MYRTQKPLKSTSVVSIRTGKKQVRFSRSSPQIFSLFEHQPHNDDNNNKSRENDGKEAILVEDELQEVLSKSQSVISMARYIYIILDLLGTLKLEMLTFALQYLIK